MNRSIEQALLSLLPTLNTPPPPQLVDLAGSFLAQSRHRASTLKAEEEIARPYACAHIACSRLKTSLNLPPINENGAPIPPRLYKRLYSHLDRILESVSLGSKPTPGRAARIGASSSSRALPSRPTPTKDRALSQFGRTANGQKGSSTSAKPGAAASLSKADAAALPRWASPTLAFICKEVGSPQLSPIAMAGLRSILVPQGHRTASAWLNDHLAGVLCTVCLYVWTSAEALKGPAGGKLDRAQYAGMRREVLDAMAKARQAVAPGDGKKRLGAEEADEETWWAEWAQPGADVLDKTMTLLSREGALEADWTSGIAGLVRGDGGDDLEGQEVEGEDGEDGMDAALGARGAKGDTMLQDRYDFLSERRRREYARWKEGMLRRIEERRAELEGSS